MNNFLSPEERVPVFHVFQKHAKAWPNVYPGDVVISPGSLVLRWNDYMNDPTDSKIIIVQQKPLIVISVLRGVIETSSRDQKVKKPVMWEPDEFKTISTFVVYSVTMGILVCLKSDVDDAILS